MYTAVEAIGVKLGVNQKWHTLDISTLSVMDIYALYRKVYVELTIGSPAITVYLDLDDIRAQWSTFTGTIDDLLQSLDGAALPTMTTLPNINTRMARFMDAFRAGYRVSPYSALYGYNVPLADRLDLLLTRAQPPVDYTDFFKTTMVSVNGFYHRTDTNGSSGVVVYKGAQTQRKSNQNQIGILSFYGMCNIDYVTITSGMITPIVTGGSLKDGVYINVPVSLVNKSVLFCIGGYLHTLSSLITKVSDNTFKIDIPNYPLFDRFYEMSAHLNIDGFMLSASSVNTQQVSVQELQSDDNIRALLTMNQSFIVVLDCPQIYTQVNYVQKTGYVGNYIAHTEPRFPLVTGLGRHNEYWYRKEGAQYSLTVYDNTVSNRIYNTVNPYFQNSVSDSELPTDPTYVAGAYFLMIARDV